MWFYINQVVKMRLDFIFLNFILMCHYKQRIMQICFRSISMDSDYHNAVFVYI